MASPLLSDLSEISDFDQAQGAAIAGHGSPLPETPLREDSVLTRALRSHQLWLTLTYLGLLVLMGRGLAG